MNRSRLPWRALALLFVVTLLPQLRATLFPDYLVQRWRGPTIRVKEIEGIQEKVQNGKLYLRLKDFLALALRNQTEIHITQLDILTAQSAVLNAKAVFDPSITLGFSSVRTQAPQFNQISGAEELNTLYQQAQAGYQQTLSTGQTVSAGFTSGRSSSNNAFVFFNPSLLTGLNFNITQPLLQNRSNIQLKAPLQIAKTQLLITSDQSDAQIADLIAGAAQQYWDAIQARDNIRVNQLSVDLAQKSYDRDKMALDLGALSPLEIYQSQSQVAQRRVSVIQAELVYRDMLDGIRRLIGADLNPATRNIEIVLDDDPSQLPALPPATGVDEAITAAVERRPELKVVHRRSMIDDLSARVSRDSMQPKLDLGVQFGSSGLAGNQIPISGPLGIGTGPLITGGIGDALWQNLTFKSPYYGFSLQMTLPVKSSAAEAGLANALVDKARQQYFQRQIEQQIIQEVKLAANQLESANQQIEASRLARDLTQKNVDAQQQKYEIGGITAFELLDAQNRLAGVEGSLVSAYTGYQKAVIAYKRATWTLLDDFGLVIEPPKMR